MAIEYKVIAEFDLFKTPSIWQLPASRMKQYAAEIEEAFNRMSSCGWRLVTSHKEPWSGVTYFTFEREAPKGQGSAQIMATRAIQASVRE